MITIACAQLNPTLEDVAANVSAIIETIDSTDADLIIFPELATTGYLFRTAEEAAPYAASVEDKSILDIRKAAQTHGRAVVIGFLERCGETGKLYNSSLLINALGDVAGKYRKIHLFYKERFVFAEGNLGLPVFPLILAGETMNIGMMICYDWRFPEPARTLAIKGADIIAVPANIVTTTSMLHPTLQTRAFENKVILAFADRFGSEQRDEETLTYRGESSIINYNGEVLASAGKSEEIISAEVDPVATRKKSFNPFNDIISDRRPDSYY